jgi:hypothetical protein
VVDGRHAGTYSRDEYFQFSKDASLQLRQPDFNMQPVGITAEGDRVAIEGETRTELEDGRVYNNKYHFLLIFEAGRIREVREYHDTQHALQTFQGPTEANALASLFAGKTPDEQKALLARLERAGGALYRAWAAQEPDPPARAALLGAAEREEQNAQVLERLAARPRGGRA